jgi:hypothetical protein
MKTAEVKIAFDIYAESAAQALARVDLITAAIEGLGFIVDESMDITATGPRDEADDEGG